MPVMRQHVSIMTFMPSSAAGIIGGGDCRACRAVDNKGAYKRLTVPGERVDAVVREHVVLIKMDVEGFEPHVLDSAKGLFDQHLVDDVRLGFKHRPAQP